MIKNMKVSELFSIKNRYADFLLAAVVILVTAIVWRGILSITLQGEGFLYFSEDAYGFDLNNFFDMKNYFPLSEDLAAKIINHLLSRVFLDNMSGYFAFLFAHTLLTVAAMYLLVRVMVGKPAAVFTALFFGLDYVANANMIISGGLQYFIQRGVLLLPALIALLLLVKFTQTKNFIYYFFSLALYLLTVFLGFFATNFLPVMGLYPLIFLLLNIRLGWRFIATFIWTPLPFIWGNYNLIKSAGALTNNTPKGTHFLTTFLQIIIDIPNNLPGLLQQLSVITLPFFWDSNILMFLKKSFGVNTTPDQQLYWAQITVVVLYAAAFIFLWKSRPAWRMVIVFSLAAFVAMLYMNLFLNAEQSLNTFSSSRYFYFPFSMGAVFWGIFFAGIFLQKKTIIKRIFLLVFLAWVGFNVYSVEKVLVEEGWRYKANREMLAIIKDKSAQLQKEPYYIYFPGSLNTLGPGGLHFAQRFYAHPKSQFDFEPPNLPKLAEKNIKPAEIIVFKFDHQTKRVSDETEKWRTELRLLQNEKRY